MRALVQRVSQACVVVDGEVVGAIRRGCVVLLGVHVTDTVKEATALAEKVAHPRIFGDDEAVRGPSRRACWSMLDARAQGER